MPIRRPIAHRFWSKVRKGAADECWLWTASTYRNGYGQFCVNRSIPRLAHRVAWWLTHGGDWPSAEMQVMHTCDIRLCCNPAHLRLASPAENMRDMVVKDRSAFGERHVGARLTSADVQRIRALYAAGVRQRVIAAEFGVGQGHISRIVLGKEWARQGDPIRRAASRRRGTEHPHAKLTDASVRDIKRRLQRGESQVSIARRYSVSQPLIGYIAKGKAWRHIKL